MAGDGHGAAMKIHIHVGVHKTATTYMQRRLRLGLAGMNREGIGHLPVWQFRNSFWKSFMELAPETFRVENHLGDFFAKKVPEQVRGLVISEENLLGLCGQFVTTGKLFNGVRPRLTHFRKLFAGHEITLFCAVRSYESFISSAYSEGLRTNRRYTKFVEFHDRIHWPSLLWPRLLERFEDSLQPVETVLWQYESFRDHEAEIMSKLAFGVKLEGVSDAREGPTYTSLSQVAIEAIDAVAARAGDEIAGKLVRPIADALPKEDGHASFDPWTPAQKQALALRYEADCRQIDPAKWLVPIGQAAAARAVA